MSNNPEFDFHLDRFLTETQTMLDEHYDVHFGNLIAPKVSIAGGRKYIKIAKTDRGSKSHPTERGSQSAYFFVDIEDGNVWKPASWKAPVKNFPRGNIFEDKASDVIGVYGI